MSKLIVKNQFQKIFIQINKNEFIDKKIPLTNL